MFSEALIPPLPKNDIMENKLYCLKISKRIHTHTHTQCARARARVCVCVCVCV
jgi:hypothetical protein